MRFYHILAPIVLFVMLVSLIGPSVPATSLASNYEVENSRVRVVQPQAGPSAVASFQVDSTMKSAGGVQRINDAGSPAVAAPDMFPDDFGDEYWSAIFGPSGMNGEVRAVAFGPDGSLYAGGTFTSAGGVPANRIARWDGTSWHPLGSGMDNIVSALVVGTNGSLYAGGNFTTAGGVAANRVARWDGASWHPLGSGMNNAINALAVSPSGTLYAGGIFTTAGGVAANRVARWDGAAWHPLGTGTNNIFVFAVAVGPDGSLYAGGNFTTAGGVAASRIARWDGSAWHPLGSGMNNTVFALSFGPDGSLYVGGAFTTAGGTAANRIARWNGTSWYPLGNGVSDVVNTIAHGSDGSTYVGGFFTAAGGLAAYRIGHWDGSAWYSLGSGLNDTVYALAVKTDASLYVGGAFTTAGRKASSYIALWTGAVSPTITEIEVNQVLGSQYEGAQKYVAGKDTVIRLHLASPVMVNFATQRVEILRDSGVVTTLSPQPSAQPTQILTFKCPNRSACGNWQEGSYLFRATVGTASAQKSVTFSARRTLRILAIPVKVRDQGIVKEPDASWKSGDVFLRHVYPVAADGVNWVLGSELDASRLDLTTSWDLRWLWTRLRLRQPLYCLVGFSGSSCYDMIVGFIPAMRTYCTTECEECGCLAGWTFGSPATIVMTNGTFETPCPNLPTKEVNGMRSTVAHEFGHTFDDPLGDEYDHPYGKYRCDNNPSPPTYEGTRWGEESTCDSDFKCTDTTVQPWPYGTGTGSLINSESARPFEINPTLPGSSSRGALPDVLSFMGSGSFQRDMWVTPRAYDHLFNQLAPVTMTEWVPASSVDAVFISGWIGQDGSVGLEPWYRVSVPLVDPVIGVYSVEAINNAGQMLASQGFDVSFIALSNPPQNIDPAPFETVVAAPAGTVAFRIKHGATTLAEVPISLNAPLIQVTAPSVGQVLSGPATIAWQSQDQDGDELYHTVEYSSNGQEWQVLTSAITQTQFIADFSQLSGSTSAQVRVTVSDGVNTATSTSGAFTVTRTPPQVSIYAPTSGSLAAWALMVTFSGGAYDYRDGWLRDPDVLTWSSDRDGTLGGGEVLRVNTLSPGLHTITLSATNSANLTASTTMALTVGAPGDLNGDGCILVDDLTAIATAWMQEADPPLDLNGDGVVTVADIVIATAGWDGQCVPDDQASRANDG